MAELNRKNENTRVKPVNSTRILEKNPGTFPQRAPMPISIGTCANCGKERPLKYARGTMCATYGCQRAAAAEVAMRKAGIRGM